MELFTGKDLAAEIFDDFNHESETEMGFYDFSTGFRCELENIGGGTARNMRLVTEVTLVESSSYEPMTSISELGYRFSNPDLQRVNQEFSAVKSDFMTEDGVALSEGERDEFIAFPAMMSAEMEMNAILSRDITSINLPDALDELESGTILIEMGIVYDYGPNSVGKKPIYRVIAPVDDVKSLYRLEDFGRALPPSLLSTFLNMARAG